MAITKQAVTILAPTSVAAGTTAASPAGGTSVNVQAFDGGEWAYKITNGASAPGVACILVLQTSHDGVNWYDFFTVAGNVAVNGVNSGSVTMTRGVMFARAIAYGNTSNAVTVESYLQAKVG